MLILSLTQILHCSISKKKAAQFLCFSYKRKRISDGTKQERQYYIPFDTLYRGNVWNEQNEAGGSILENVNRATSRGRPGF
jgi:hypothetical protein